ncbi:monooxygenase [Quadrisphaera sp. DSM 44207]|uniref:monooxygenase n=1 Tax=Quadrisphaera sp. DSM 44207 TaxID=1881057 RepID=UPI00088B20D9|nr:monooxygenase [Quadrisphaera sp. DSM 44207]SDQ78942.1 spheroidene monooxygenase [Quadrisphaera sp. DSM 44207]
MSASQPPAVVTLHVWGVRGRSVPAAAARMALDRPLLRRGPARFWKLLGTGSGRTFTARDADPRHWALLAAWERPEDAEEFEDGATARAWGRLATERLRVALAPLASRGRWSGAEPFGSPRPSRERAGGPVASLTRARIRLGQELAFRRAVPPVSEDLQRVEGLRLALGVGEAPVGLQGTFSLWSDAAALQRFAHRRAAHQEVVARTAERRWYAEELFARFAVLDVDGTYRGRHP